MDDIYSLYLQEEVHGRSKLGKGTVRDPKVGMKLRVLTKQSRYVDVCVARIDKESRVLIVEKFEGTAHFLHLLEHFVYKAREAYRAGVNLDEQIRSVYHTFRDVCQHGGDHLACEHLARMTKLIQAKEEPNG